MDTWKTILAVLAAVGVALVAAFGIGFGVYGTTGTTTTTTTTMKPEPWMPNSVAKAYRYYAVTSGTNVCSQIGVDILQKKMGSATDAASAIMLCDGIVNMQATGIGGGGFATIYEKPRNGTMKEFKAVFFRERAPGNATQMMFQNTSSLVGGLAVGIPGMIKGIYEMWKYYGKVEWQDIFNPTIDLLEKGFRIENHLSQYIKEYEMQIKERPTLREIFVLPDGTMRKEGDIFTDFKLAQTLRTVASNSSMGSSFYTGKLAEDIAADIKEQGGIITADDLRNYKTSMKDPLMFKAPDGKYTFYNPPPPSSGVVVNFILNILSGYNMSPADVADQEKMNLAYHRIIEAFRFAYAKRGFLGDLDFVNVTELMNNMMSLDYGTQIRLKINDNMTQKADVYEPGFAVSPDNGTAHVNVLTQDGAAVAVTSTINTPFGSLVRGSRTGIIFNNEMDDFSTPGTVNAYGYPASPSNFIVPGKIPQSSMSPTIVKDNNSGKIIFLVGAGDGSKIISTNTQILINSLWFGKSLEDSVDTARIHDQLSPDESQYETWINEDLLMSLKTRGHNMVPNYRSLAFSGAIHDMCQEGEQREACIYAVADGRRGGVPDGLRRK